MCILKVAFSSVEALKLRSRDRGDLATPERSHIFLGTLNQSVGCGYQGTDFFAKLRGRCTAYFS